MSHAIQTLQIEFHDSNDTHWDVNSILDNLTDKLVYGGGVYVYDDGTSKRDGIRRVVVTPYNRANVSIDLEDADTMELLDMLAASSGKSIKDTIKELAEKELNK